MKNKSVFVLLLSSLLLFSCGSLSKGSETPSSGGNQENTPSEPGETDPGTGGGSTSGDSTGGGSSTIIGEDPEEGSEDWQLGRVKLPNYADGYELYSCGKPINYNSPIEMPTTFTNTDDQWLKGDWSEEIPDNWIYSYGNSYSNGPSGHYVGSPDFYPSNNGYGAKFTKPNQGFCTPRFSHTGEKLEIRFTISTVRNANGSAEKNTKPFKVYFFSSENKVIGMWESEKDVIPTKTTEVKFYWTTSASQVAWFEVRLAAQAHNGTQQYNFGLKEVKIKSWPRA